MKIIKKTLPIITSVFVLNSGIISLAAEDFISTDLFSYESEAASTKGAAYNEVKELDDFLNVQKINSLSDCELLFFRPFFQDKDSDLSIEKIITGNEEDADRIEKLLTENKYSENLYEIISDPGIENNDVYDKYFSSCENCYIYGDLNDDHVTDLTDLSYLSLYLLGETEFDDILTESADIDANGIVDIADLAYYKQYVCKDTAALSNIRINGKFLPAAGADTEKTIKAVKTIEDGIYYIKNKNSGRYLDIYNNEKTNYTKVVQYSYHAGLNQRYKVSFHEETNGESYYTIEPMHISENKKAFDLSGKKEACSAGTGLNIFSSNSVNYEEQRFMIKSEDDGFQICSWLSNGDILLRPADASTSSGTEIQTFKNSECGDEGIWYFEPVGKGMTYQIVTTRISDSDIEQGKDITASFKELGYDAVYRYNADKDTIKADSENASVIIFHGHANAGGIKTDVDGSWIIPAANPQANSNCVMISDIIKPETANNVQLVYFCTCDGAAVDDTYGISMVDATYELGVKCVIGFKYGVAGGEDYLQYMMNYLKSHKGATIKSALNYADSLYSDSQKKSESSPANSDNRVVRGNSNIILDLRQN